MSMISPNNIHTPFDAGDIPCKHRGAHVGNVAVTPCQRRWSHIKNAPVYRCDLLKQLVTIHPYCAKGADGKRLHVCLGCDYADEEPERDRPVPTPPADATPVMEGPLYANHDGVNASALRGIYQGCDVFLVCGGPSLNSMDLSILNQRGLLVASCNNVAATHVRPHLWFCVDRPDQFHESIWFDPGILKFIKRKHLDSKIVSNIQGRRVATMKDARDCPSVITYQHCNGWNPATFLTQEPITWGVNRPPSEGDKGNRHQSVMLIALRLLYDLGFSRVFLLGCDFHMNDETPYAFAENGKNNKGETRAKSNNVLFRWLNKRLKEVEPHFRAAGYNVINCTPGSKLEAFEAMTLADAVKSSLSVFPPHVETRGHYR